MSTKSLLFGFALLPGLCAAIDHPVEELIELDLAVLMTMKVEISTGTPKPLNKAPAVATVITAADIQAMGARSLDEVLESVPGVHVGRSTLAWLNPVYGIRGLAIGLNPHTLFLINGVRFYDLHTGARMYALRLPVSAIERIEVIRGPGAAIYGADAFAGVINIITKRGEDLAGGQLAIRRGSFDVQDGLAQWGGGVGDWELALSVESQRSDGDDGRIVASDLQSLLDRRFGTQASLAPGALQTNYDVLDSHIALDNARWRLNFWNWQQRGAGIGQGAASTLDPVGRTEFDQSLFDLGYDVPGLASDWDLNLRYSFQYADRLVRFQLFPPGTVLPIGADGNVNFTTPAGLVRFPEGYLGNPGSRSELHYAELTLAYRGGADHHLRFSLGGRHDEQTNRETKNFGPGVIDGTQPVVDGQLTDVTGTPYIFYPGAKRRVRFVTAQDEWRFAAAWELTAGVRYDDYSDFGQTTNPRLALVWSVADNLTAKLLYGSAFRAPSFCELYCRNNPATQGNRDLKPETIDTLELALDYLPTAHWHVALSVFDYRAKDLVEFVTDPSTSARVARNARDQNGRGFELEADWLPTAAWRLRANYAYQDATDATTGAAIANVPRQHAYANLGWHIADRWQATTQLNWVADRRRAPNDARPAVKDYTWTDVTLRNVLPGERWAVMVSVRNVFDRLAREPSAGNIDDYPLEGRSVFAEVSYQY